MHGNKTLRRLVHPASYTRTLSTRALNRKSYQLSDFRSDINGLRAIAVLSVVFFHFGVGGAQGGYVGVDVFFVISGYLMTCIIWNGLNAGCFSLLAFTWDRVARVSPALLAMTACVLGLGAIISLPDDWVVTARQAAWSTVFAINILFIRDINYFSPLAINSWFLHCWSLSLEFQFYVIYPAFLLILRSWFSTRLTLIVILCLTAVSLTYCTAVSQTDLNKAFYFMPARFWEFTAGGAVLFIPGVDDVSLRYNVDRLALLALSCIVWKYNSDLVYPGLWPVLPVICTMGIIWANVQNLLLVNPFSQFMGTISYSIYLWHWPTLFTFRYFGLADDSQNIPLMFTVTVVVSYLSYYLIESTSRTRLRTISVRTLTTLIGSVFAVLTACAWIEITLGMPGRLNEATRELVESAVYANDWREGQCFLQPEQDFSRFDPICFGAKVKKSGRPKLLLWGDSHAAQLYPGLASRPWAADYDIEQLTASACNPIATTFSTDRPHCSDIQRATLAMALDQKPDIVLLSGAWISWQRTSVPKQIDQFISAIVGITRLVHTLRAGGISKVIVLGPTPQWELSLPQVYFREEFRTGKPLPEYIQPLQSLDGMALFDSVLAKSISNVGGDYVPMFEKMCHASGCRPDVETAVGPALMAFDGEHLTRAGSDWLADHVIGPTLGAVVAVQREIAPDSLLLFDSAGQGTPYLASGWRSPEPWGTWSLTTRAGIVVLPVRTWEPRALEITFSGQLGGAFITEHFELQIAGDEPVQLTVTRDHPVASASIPIGPRARALISEFGFLRLRVTAPYGESPTEMGQNADDRKLGFGLRDLKLH